MVDVLDVRTLNRTLLRRQQLLERADRAEMEMIEHLVGLQAQQAAAPYFGLWTRLTGFRTEALAKLLNDREVVRIKMMRGTVHLVSSADCRWLRPVLEPIYEAWMRTVLGESVAVQDLREDLRRHLEQRPHTNAELREALGERWPDVPLASAATSLLPAVQVPPRGIWGKSGQATHTTAGMWLGAPLDETVNPGEMVRRYLAAFGPASVRDIQVCSGLNRLRETVDQLNLRVFHDQEGVELFDLPDAPLAESAEPAPVRFLPAYDNCLRSHADRARMMSEEVRKALQRPNDAPVPTFLVDGFVRGTWRWERKRGVATLSVEPFEPLNRRERDDVFAEAANLLAFAAPSDRPDIRLA